MLGIIHFLCTYLHLLLFHSDFFTNGVGFLLSTFLGNPITVSPFPLGLPFFFILGGIHFRRHLNINYLNFSIIANFIYATNKQ